MRVRECFWDWRSDVFFVFPLTLHFPSPFPSSSESRIPPLFATTSPTMGRMHSKGKGMSSSALPYKRSPPSWLKTTATEVRVGRGGPATLPAAPHRPRGV